MKENKYDDQEFFDQYSKMNRSIKGLSGAGEWHVFRAMLPSLKNKRVLDLGCGYGWHCQYAAERGADLVIGTDISEKMLEVAREKTTYLQVEYKNIAIEDIDFPENSFDVVLSSLAFHYIESFEQICKKVKQCLISGGDFIFSVEHPVFTAYGTQDWYYDDQGNRLHWPVDRYFFEGERATIFLEKEIVKYHKTLTTYVETLLNNGFELTGLREPEPDSKMLEQYPEYKDELRRPMILLLSAKKK